MLLKNQVLQPGRLLADGVDGAAIQGQVVQILKPQSIGPRLHRTETSEEEAAGLGGSHHLRRVGTREVDVQIDDINLFSAEAPPFLRDGSCMIGAGCSN